MKIKNPLDKDLNLNYKGTNYVLEAGVSKDFEPEVAAHWVHIYGFLSIVKATDKEKDVVVEEVKEIEKKAAPKKTARKTTKKE